MKKFFFFAAAMAASMSMMAQQPAVEFHYLPGATDVNSAGEAYNSADKGVAVEADYTFISGTKFTVKNAYATSYKAVGLVTDTAYNSLQIGNEVIDFKNQRIQGQANPKDAAGGNPGTSLKVPTQGACFKVEVTEPGILVVAVKATPNKNQFAYSDLEGAGSALVATPNEYVYALMSVNTTGTPIGNPDGCLQILVEGDDFGELHSSPATPAELYGNGTYNVNGIGVMLVQVTPEQSPYLIGTGGSKMMAAGFGFVAANDPNLANFSIVALGCQDKNGNPHDNVTLFDATYGANPNVKAQDLSKELKEVKITAYVPDAWVNDTVGYGVNELKKKIGCYVWGNNLDGVIHEMAVDKDNNHKFTYTAKVDESALPLNCIFINSHLETSGDKQVVSINWNGDPNQTVDLKGINADICYIVSAAAAGKATAVVDTECAGPTGLDEINVEAMQDKFILDGHLYIKKNGRIFNANGAIVK